MWGSMCGQGIGAFTTVNEFTVIDVLEHFFFIPSIENYIGDDVIFQDDNASCRRANQVKSFLQNWSINTLVRPLNNPDLNSIENVWFKLKKLIKAKAPQTRNELMASMHQCWKNIDKNI